MTAARRLPDQRLHRGGTHNPYTEFPALASIRRKGASLKVVRPAGRSTLTLAPFRRALSRAGNRKKNGHTRPLDRPRSFRDDLH